MLKKPEIKPFSKEPPLAVFPMPEMKPDAAPPFAELKKPETSVPVLPKPEVVAPVSAMDPKPVFVSPEFQNPVLTFPEFPKPVFV